MIDKSAININKSSILENSQKKIITGGNDQLDESQIQGSLQPSLAPERWQDNDNDSEDLSIDLEEMPFPIHKIKRIDKTNEN